MFRKFILCSSRLIQSFEQQCRQIYALDDSSADPLMHLQECGLDYSDKFRSQLHILMNDLDILAQQISEISEPNEELLQELEFQYERISQIEKYWHLCEISQYHNQQFLSLEFAKWLKV